MGIFDGISDTIDGLFGSIAETIGLDTSPTDASGDFFGNKVAGALFNGKSSSSKSTVTNAPNYGMVGVGRPAIGSTKTKAAQFTDPKQIEAEWTNRLFKFANLNKLVSNTAGKLPS